MYLREVPVKKFEHLLQDWNTASAFRCVCELDTSVHPRKTPRERILHVKKSRPHVSSTLLVSHRRILLRAISSNHGSKILIPVAFPY
jgi:hypothetical protein